MRVPDSTEETTTGRTQSPHPEVQPANKPPVQSLQLAQFLRWLVPLVFGFTLLQRLAVRLHQGQP